MATLEFGAAVGQNIVLDAGADGTLKLDHAADFTGAISGFDGDDQLDLGDIDFGAELMLDYAANQDGTGGTLTVTDGVDTAQIDLVGQYDAAGFSASADVGTGTLIEYVLTGLTPTT